MKMTEETAFMGRRMWLTPKFVYCPSLPYAELQAATPQILTRAPGNPPAKVNYDDRTALHPCSISSAAAQCMAAQRLTRSVYIALLKTLRRVEKTLAHNVAGPD